jgi:hypothetical protein
MCASVKEKTCVGWCDVTTSPWWPQPCAAASPRSRQLSRAPLTQLCHVYTRFRVMRRFLSGRAWSPQPVQHRKGAPRWVVLTPAHQHAPSHPSQSRRCRGRWGTSYVGLVVVFIAGKSVMALTVDSIGMYPLCHPCPSSPTHTLSAWCHRLVACILLFSAKASPSFALLGR